MHWKMNLWFNARSSLFVFGFASLWSDIFANRLVLQLSTTACYSRFSTSAAQQCQQQFYAKRKGKMFESFKVIIFYIHIWKFYLIVENCSLLICWMLCCCAVNGSRHAAWVKNGTQLRMQMAWKIRSFFNPFCNYWSELNRQTRIIESINNIERWIMSSHKQLLAICFRIF